MTTLVVETLIAAPADVCFDLARSLTVHTATTAKTRERILSKHDHDLLELGDEVIFEARHLGKRRRLTSRIIEFDRPRRFVDEMVKGDIGRLRHEHRFEDRGGGLTAMIDILEFESKFGLVDSLILKPYFGRFLRYRAEGLKSTAEHQIR